ncbi:histone-lysine N-methyltransferase SETMAR [Trichonephila clavata]|uniref:Histone-lysine N-methyltransferase SETMAR n=1 Tax=Trichonephila clavata TaxID=2740835 RepID=A0A8X6LJR2_TRICU|nr:histone-lysine N-methyltransferase SETMAR [Trichonephila clavata]
MVRRWCRTFSDGRQQVEDKPRAGRTRTATTDKNVGKVDDMIRANRRITIDEVAEERGISHERAQNIIHAILRYRKVLARWVPRQLTSTHQEQRMAVSLEHLVRYHEDGNDFLFRIVTGDENVGPPFHARIEGRIYGVGTSVITCPKEVQDNSLCR